MRSILNDVTLDVVSATDFTMKLNEEKKGLMSSETVDHNIQDWNKYLAGTDLTKMSIKSITGGIWSDFSMNLVGNGKIKQRWKENTIYVHRSIVYRKVYDEALGREVKRPTELLRTKGKKKEANRVIPLIENAIDGIRICPSPEKKGNTGLLRRHFSHSRSHSRSYLQAALL